MSYYTKANVAAISGIDSADLNDTLLTLADRHVESLLGYDMDGGVASRTQYFDVFRRNSFYTNYNGIWSFPLDRHPVVSITSVTDGDQSSDPTTLEDTGNPPDYWMEESENSVKIYDSLDLTKGQRELKVVYTWGYASIPDIIKEYADYYAAMIQELKTAKSDSGGVLKEYEMGRYRELYDTSNLSVRTKYSGFGMDELKEQIEAEYKLWP